MLKIDSDEKRKKADYYLSICNALIFLASYFGLDSHSIS